VLDDDELGDLLAHLAPREAAMRVVTRAIEAGSRDNATAIVIRVS
jgi:serine/threonine protein phosphatase PrpC